jgi:hypothetical protein
MLSNIPDELKQVSQWICDRIDYNKETGKFYYKKRNFGDNPTPRQKQFNAIYPGKEAGFSNGEGYIKISIEKKIFYAHRLAFLIVTGKTPEFVDHINLNRSDNRWMNLRECKLTENASNATQRNKNKTKLKGVSWSKSNDCWRMDIQHKGVKYYSYHLTKEAAYEAYCLKSKELHKEFSNVQ